MKCTLHRLAALPTDAHRESSDNRYQQQQQPRRHHDLRLPRREVAGGEAGRGGGRAHGGECPGDRCGVRPDRGGAAAGRAGCDSAGQSRAGLADPGAGVDAARHRQPTLILEGWDSDTTEAQIGVNYAIAMAPGAGSDEVFARSEKLLGRNGIAEEVALLGYYTSVAMGMKLHRVPVPA